MPALDQVLAPPASSPGTTVVLEGDLVVKGSKRYARVDGSDALWGPLLGGDALVDGDLVAIGISQDGRPFVIWPASGGGGGGDTDVDATASASTLSAGSNASVAVTEPSPNLFDFAFGIPRGNTGAQGVKGDTGAQGPKGDTGATGAQGPAGVSPTINAAAAYAPAKGATVNLGGTWAAVPLPSLTIEPSDAFTYVGNTVTVKDEGWYHVAASVTNADAVSNQLFISLDTDAGAGDGTIANNGTSSVSPRAGCDGTVKLAAGAKVYLWAYSPASTLNVYCSNFSIERVGGPTGPQGPAGAPGATSNYVQFATGATQTSVAGYTALPFGVIANSAGSAIQRNANGTATILADGVYQINATGACQTQLGANSRAQYTLNIDGNPVAVDSGYAPYANAALSWAGKINAGSVVSLHVYMDGAGATVQSWPSSIVAVTSGPRGDTGPQGAATGALACYQMGGWASAVSSNGTWVTLPINATGTSDPAGAFTRNADNSITVRDAGWYAISASMITGNVFDGVVTISVGSAANAEGYWANSSTRGSTVANAAPCVSASAVQIAAGGKVYLTGWAQSTQNLAMRYLTIARLR